MQVDFRKVSRIWAFVAAPAGLLMIALAVREHRLAFGIWAGVLLLSAIPPLLEVVFVILIGIGALVVFLPSRMVKGFFTRRRQQKAILELDRLGQQGARPEEYRPLVAQLDRPEPEVIPAILERVLDRRCPYREQLFWHAGPGTLDEIARREDDPLAVPSWHRGLSRRHDVNRMHAGLLLRVKSEVPAEELRALWKRAMKSSEFWALPPELEIHEEVP